MKTKERTLPKSTKSTKQNNRAPISETNVDYDEVKKKLNQGNMLVAEPIRKTTKKGPSKTQINRLKQFYNTTRFTTQLVGYQTVPLLPTSANPLSKTTATAIPIPYMVVFSTGITCFLIT